MRYTVDEVIEVGIVLTGAEVKSLRAGNTDGARRHLRDGAQRPAHAHQRVHRAVQVRDRPKVEEKRARRLLAHRAEIDRIDGKVSQKGLTLIALKAYFKDNSKVNAVGLAHAKDGADRRRRSSAREGDREARAAIKRRMH